MWGTRAVDRSVYRVQNRVISRVGIHHPIKALETDWSWIPTIGGE